MFISYWKMILFFSCMLLFLYLNGTSPSTLFSQFGPAFRNHPINVTVIDDRIKASDYTVADVAGGLLKEGPGPGSVSLKRHKG